MEGLFEHAIKGFNSMPPKGTCADCSDDEIKGAVKYMVDKSK
jgi:cytochrome c5